MIDSFPIEENLIGETIESLDSVRKPYSILWDEGKCYVSTKCEYMLEIYDEKERKITKKLRRGNGLNEWIAPAIMNQKIRRDGHSYICVLERANMNLYGVDVEDSCSERIRLADYRKYDIPGIRNVYILPDSSSWGFKDGDNCDVFRCNSKCSELMEYEIGIDHSLFAYNRAQLSQNLSTYNAKEESVAVVYYAYPLLLITKVENPAVVKEIQIDESFPVYDKESSINPNIYMLDICSTDKYIYVLYDDQVCEDKSSILVFDWNGNAVAKFNTPKMIAFAVDEEHGRFFGLNEDDSEGVCSVYKYQLHK